MPRRMFVFDPPDRFVAGTIGVPGNRTFFLQARRSGQVVSVVLEKVQVAVLAERLGVLLDELEERGISTAAAAAVDDQPLDEPINEAFRATTLTLGWDGDADRILVEARAEAGGDEDDDEEADDDDDDEPDEDETVIDLSTVEGLAGTPAGELLAAFEAADNDDEGPDTLRVRLTADAARGFVNRAIEVVGAGRLPCPLCGQPLDPQGHICPRRNGHYVN
ncbi:MAG TPA: DUF3090 family protein [Candidatus Limnocylindrales bacterium]|nr:DUF3090 family protein [Candidatus Limnocylindrales bacterium]